MISQLSQERSRFHAQVDRPIYIYIYNPVSASHPVRTTRHFVTHSANRGMPLRDREVIYYRWCNKDSPRAAKEQRATDEALVYRLTSNIQLTCCPPGDIAEYRDASSASSSSSSSSLFSLLPSFLPISSQPFFFQRKEIAHSKKTRS